VLEALAAGKAVVASPQALEGLQAVAGQHVVEARDADHWIAEIPRLWEDADKRRRLGAAARRYVVERHSWDRCLAPLDEWLPPGGATASA
jgi:glycosyltransferase involved in cell wall biosynthesis